jgi:hypothetical protein
MKRYPKILNVEPMAGKKLLVSFNNNIKKIYDCSPLIDDEIFKPLSNDTFFNSVRADKHGYGVIWSDELDLSESELWINGLLSDQGIEN